MEFIHNRYGVYVDKDGYIAGFAPMINPDLSAMNFEVTNISIDGVNMFSTKIKSGGFIVGSQTKDGDHVSFSMNPVVHESLNSAKTEAVRLAHLNKNKRFLVTEIKGVVEVNDVVWS